MELKDFLRQYRKHQKLSVRKFAELMQVSNFRLEKWEKGSNPNYQDTIKIKRYFRLEEIQNISEDFLSKFVPNDLRTEKDELLEMKDLIIEEKDKRIQALEETISILRETQKQLYEAKKS